MYWSHGIQKMVYRYKEKRWKYNQIRSLLLWTVQRWSQEQQLICYSKRKFGAARFNLFMVRIVIIFFFWPVWLDLYQIGFLLVPQRFWKGHFHCFNYKLNETLLLKFCTRQHIVKDFSSHSRTWFIPNLHVRIKQPSRIKIHVILIGLLLDSKKSAEEELDREIGNVVEVEAVNTGDKGESSMAKRSRKRKSYGDDFEENEEQTTREETDGMAF